MKRMKHDLERISLILHTMLLYLLFCPMFEAVKVSEKVAVATLTKEFAKPWSELFCFAKPQPEVWLWKQPIHPPQTRFIPNYEVLNDTLYVTRLLDKYNKRQIILLELNHQSDKDLQAAMTIKNQYKDSAIVMSQDSCLRGPLSNSTQSTTTSTTFTNCFKKVFQSITVQNYEPFETDWRRVKICLRNDYENCNFRNMMKKVWFEVSNLIAIIKIPFFFSHLF